MNSEPIFIAGPDRSGTTLMYALLASHPNISMVRRTNMWRYFHGRYGDLAQAENFERCLSDMVRYKRMRHLQPDAERIRREFGQGEPTYGHLFALFHEHHAERAGKTRWADKSLHSEHYADRIVAEFPNARILHMIRDPRDRYASVRKRYGKDTRRLGAATGRWLLSAQAAKRNQKRYPDNYRVIQYEKLASCPEATLLEICDFIHEPYRPEMLLMQGAAEHREQGGNSSFAPFEPGVISTRSIGRFRTVLSPEEIAYIQLFAGRDMRRFDYSLITTRLSPRERLKYLTYDLPANLGRMAGWLTTTIVAIRRGISVPPSKLLAG